MNAFPTPPSKEPLYFVNGIPKYGESPGMSLRDYLAAKAMHIAYMHWEGAHPDGFDGLSKFAYQYADSMLKARES